MRRFKCLDFCKSNISLGEGAHADSFCSVQECILSGIYIKETIRILRTSLKANARKFMYQLFAVNIIIIAMDIALLGVEFANLYIIETFLKGVIYSIKLKLEFVVLGKLVQFVTRNPTSIDDDQPSGSGVRSQPRRRSDARRSSDVRRRCSSALGRKYGKDEEVPDFVDPNKLTQDYTHVSPPIPPVVQPRKNSRPHVTDSELSLALFEHIESAPLPPEQAALASEKNLSRAHAMC